METHDETGDGPFWIPVTVVCALLGFSWLVAASFTLRGVEPDFFQSILAVWGAFGLAIVWLIVAGSYAVHTLVRRRLLRPLWTMALLPAIPLSFLGWGILAAGDIPLRVRFELSEGSLNEYVAQVRADPERYHFDSRRVGLFGVRDVDVQDGCVRMITQPSFVDDAGLVHCDHRPPNMGEDRYWHLWGDWWGWHRSW